jgi:hypothetical protein
MEWGCELDGVIKVATNCLPILLRTKRKKGMGGAIHD